MTPSTDAAPPVPQQTLRRMRIRCRFDTPVDVTALDAWFRDALEIAIEPCPTPRGKPDSHDDEQRVALTWRVLLLFRSLMQAAQIPVFDVGRVIGILPSRRDPSTWTAVIAIAHVEQIPPGAYALALDGAHTLTRWMGERPHTPENVEALYADIERQVLKPIRRQISSGNSTLQVLRAAHAQDVPFLHLGGGTYQLGWGSLSRRIDRSTTDRDSAIGAKIAQNKARAAHLMRLAGLPAPQHAIAAGEEDARRIARQFGWPLVVKPVDRDRGEGVTVGIGDEAALLTAFKTARSLSRTRSAIIERQAQGICHRLFVARGKLLFVAKRWPKSVIGDSRRSVAELIHAANAEEARRPPWLRLPRFHDDTPAREAMAVAGYSRESVPAMGERVPLRKFQSTAWGGIYEDVTDLIHPQNRELALRAAALFDLDVAGVDLITPDIAVPWHENGAILNEVNFAPMLGTQEVSRRKSGEFIGLLIDGNGRIPVEVFIGNVAAISAAMTRQRELAAKGIGGFLTSHILTLVPTGEELPLPYRSLYRRCRALQLDKRVEALVLVIQTDEFLRTGLPVDRIDKITQGADSTEATMPQVSLAKLLKLLQSRLVGA